MATSQSVPTDRSQWMSEDHNKVADAIVELQGIANGGSLPAMRVYSPLDAVYGAAGNGSTDDTAALQAAIDAANAAGGGVVVLAPGHTFKITSTLTWKAGVSIQGGIRSATSAEEYTKILWAGGASPMIQSDVTSTNRGWRWMQHVLLNGGPSGARASAGIVFADRVDALLSISDCAIQALDGDGIQLQAGGINVWWDRIRFDGISGYAVNWVVSGQDSFRFTDLEIDNKGGRSDLANGGRGFLFDNSASVSNNRILGGIEGGRWETNLAISATEGWLKLSGNGTATNPQFSIALRDVDLEGSTTWLYGSGTSKYQVVVDNCQLGSTGAIANAPGAANIGTSGYCIHADLPSVVGRDRPSIRVNGLGRLVENFDLGACAANTALTAGTIYGQALGFRGGDVITNLCVGVAIAAVGTVPTLTRLGLADSTGKVVAITADISSSMTTAGIRPLAITGGPYVIPADGAYTLVMIQVGSWGTTQPTLGRGGTMAVQALSGAMSGKLPPYAIYGTSQSDLPAVSSNLAAAAQTTLPWWCGAN